MVRKATGRKLVKAYALMIFSADEGAPMRAQQRFYDKFQSLHQRLTKKYHDFDMASENFWRQLELRATAWWKSRPFRGTAVDW